MMTIPRAVATVVACTVLLGGIGAGIGWALGTFLPGYYRSAFRSWNDPLFDPIAVGFGQGLTQGFFGGIVVGLVVVALWMRRESRAAKSGTQEPKKKRPPKLIWTVLVAVLLIIASPFVVFMFWLYTSGGNGSEAEAIRLKAIVTSINTPESGEGCHPEYANKRFQDGEWVLGIGRDSHAWLSKYRGGGTIVVKDSRGQVRSFFGHVCGRDGLRAEMVEANSLDEFYNKQMKHFAEYPLP